MTSALHELMALELAARHPADAASEIERAEASDAAAFLAGHPERVAISVINRMTPERAARLMLALGEDDLRRLLPPLEVNQASSVLRWLDRGDRERVLALLGVGDARELRRSLVYPADTAGALMDPKAIAVRPEATVADALDRLQAAPREIHQIHVADDDHKLIGAVSVSQLALAAHDQRIDELVDRHPGAIHDMATREEVVERMTSIGLPSLAVVSQDRELLGVLRYRALVGAAEEEALADLAMMVGASRDERALSPALFAVKKRLPWLFINLATAFLAATVVGLFEGTLAQITALAVLMPVVAGQSGNAGSQALAITMRGVALREVRGTHWFRLAAKEVMVGMLNGLAIATLCGAGVYLWSGSPGIATVISAAMIMAMAAAGLAGASIPLLLIRLGQDPATASSILLTTVTDVVGFLSFLGLATLFLL